MYYREINARDPVCHHLLARCLKLANIELALGLVPAWEVQDTYFVTQGESLQTRIYVIAEPWVKRMWLELLQELPGETHDAAIHRHRVSTDTRPVGHEAVRLAVAEALRDGANCYLRPHRIPPSKRLEQAQRAYHPGHPDVLPVEEGELLNEGPEVGRGLEVVVPEEVPVGVVVELGLYLLGEGPPPRVVYVVYPGGIRCRIFYWN